MAAFTAATAQATIRIGTMNPDGSGQILITEDAGEPTGLNWSPDLHRIVYNSNSTGFREVYEYDVAADELCQLTDYNDSYGQWGGRYLDDDHIWYRWVGGGGGQFEYRELITSGCSVIDESTIFSHPGWSLSTMDISANYYFLHVQTGSSGNTEEIFKAPIDDPANLTQLTVNSVPDRSPDVSHDGSRIVYLQAYGDGRTNNVWVMNVDGSDKTQLTFEPDGSIYSSAITYPQWSDDGNSIFYSYWNGSQWDIYMVPANGSGSPVNITDSPTESERAWHCRAGRVLFTTTAEINAVNLVVALDIKPGSCPNPLNINAAESEYYIYVDDLLNDSQPGNDAGEITKVNPVKKRGVIPVAILGTDDFDVSLVDVATVMMQGVSSLRNSYEDVSTPIGDDAAECECTDAGPDGYLDLTLKFDKTDVAATLGVINVGDVIPLEITGQLQDGIPFTGTDCVVIVGNPNTAYAQNESSIFGLVNYPNPFNPTTQISFSLPSDSYVTLEVYNIMGQRVTSLVNDYRQAGNYTVTWDGRNDAGSSVASGIYFYRIQAGDYSESKKMMLMK